MPAGRTRVRTRVTVPSCTAQLCALRNKAWHVARILFQVCVCPLLSRTGRRLQSREGLIVFHWEGLLLSIGGRTFVVPTRNVEISDQ